MIFFARAAREGKIELGTLLGGRTRPFRGSGHPPAHPCFARTDENHLYPVLFIKKVADP